MELDKKDRWRSFREEIYKHFFPETLRAGDVLNRMHRYNGAIYETPKTYVDGVAYNDGSWVKYVHNDKKFCKDKEEVAHFLYGYVCFLLKTGIDDVDELWYFSVCFLIERLEYKKGLFGCSFENKGKIQEVIQKVVSRKPDAKTAIKDDREFCLDPSEIKGMSIGEKTSLQKRIQKKLTDERIAKSYDRQLSVRENAKMFKEKGLDISPSRLQQWIKENGR